MATSSQQTPPFVVRDCTLIAVATGRRAQNLRELRDILMTVHPGCVYNHFWGRLLRPRFDDPEYNNDFASWVKHALHDSTLAERLAVIDPAHYANIEDLRSEIIDVIDERLDETPYLTWARFDEQLHFVRAQTVVFDTGRRIHNINELTDIVPRLSLGSIYYHVIDARWRPPLITDDFREWINQYFPERDRLLADLSAVDPYFINLSDLRGNLTEVLIRHQENH